MSSSERSAAVGGDEVSSSGSESGGSELTGRSVRCRGIAEPRGGLIELRGGGADCERGADGIIESRRGGLGMSSDGIFNLSPKPPDYTSTARLRTE
jgi:hypothetical protein